MAYTKTNWVNDQTELNAENMNHIEDGIYNSQNVEIIAISDEAPTSCVTGDKYYNTEDNLIYTATGTDTWSEDGEEPIRDVFYILFSEQSSYSYDGTTLVSVGGGTEDIVISDEEPTEEGVKIWIDTGEIASPVSEITNSYSTSTGIGYSANYINNMFDAGTNYYEFPNGLAICWGEVATNDMSTDSGIGGYSKTVQLPITYSSTPIALNGFRYQSGMTTTTIKNITTNSITLGCNAQGIGIYVPYLVIGYK